MCLLLNWVLSRIQACLLCLPCFKNKLWLNSGYTTLFLIGIWSWQLPTSKYFEEEKNCLFSLQIKIVRYWFVSVYMESTDNQHEILLINVFSSMSISAGCLFNVPLGLLYQISLRAESLRWDCMYLLYPTISLEGFATRIFKEFNYIIGFQFLVLFCSSRIRV